MKLIHLTSENPFKLKPITIKNKPYFAKPDGGIWACPVESQYNWEWWCKQEAFTDGLRPHKIILEVETKNILTIKNEKDLQKMHFAVAGEIGIEYPDFEKIKKQYDLIHLTEAGKTKARLSMPRNLYGWDVECALILNEQCIKTITPIS